MIVGVSKSIRYCLGFDTKGLKNRQISVGTGFAYVVVEEVIMKKLKRCAIIGLVTLAMLILISCEQVAVSNKDVADDALSVLKSLRGAASYVPREDGEYSGPGPLTVDSFYIDDTTYGVRSVGWVFWDDNDTPEDTLDDIFKFIGKNEYLDWNFTENWFLEVKVNPGDRETEMAVKNTTTEESLYVHFGSVNRPGGIQWGPGTYSNPMESIDIVMGIHHAETPDDYDDNYAFLEFFLYADAASSPAQFWVHADFRPNNSGSGEIREEDAGGVILATFEWDEFGRGSMVVDGSIYPFEW